MPEVRNPRLSRSAALSWGDNEVIVMLLLTGLAGNPVFLIWPSHTHPDQQAQPWTGYR